MRWAASGPEGGDGALGVVQRDDGPQHLCSRSDQRHWSAHRMQATPAESCLLSLRGKWERRWGCGRYGSTQELAADGAWWAKLLARSVSVRMGLVQMDQQVNALVEEARRSLVPALALRSQAAARARRRLARMFLAP